MPSPALGFSLPPRYRIDGHVAAGGMASVYAAHDTLLDRPVAVKVLAEHLNEDAAARERFQREARAAAALSFHPGIVTIFDVGEHEGRSFIVMELLRGGTIGDVLRSDERPDVQRVLGWIREVAAALDTAHDRGIVHRDIKPANLLLDEKGTIAVADFGIARLAWEDAVTMTGQVLGTAAYISPEQAQGDPATAASDRYALAVVAYELLTASRPFDGEHFAAQARAHIEDEPTPPSHRDPSLPRSLDPVFSRGMAKDPAARWPTAAAFAEALADALRPTEVHAAPEPPAPAEPVTTQRMPEGAYRVSRRPAPASAPASAPDGRSRRRNLLPVALGLGLLALALAAIVLGSSGGGDDPERTAATPAREKPASEEAAPEATAEPAAEETPEAADPAAPTAKGKGKGKAKKKPGSGGGEVPAGSDPQALDAQGFQLLNRQRYDEAIPYFQKAIDLCGGSDAAYCGYALFNMGTALNRSGRPDEAIPFLEQRLDRFPGDRPEVVRRELASACQAAGQDCG